MFVLTCRLVSSMLHKINYKMNNLLWRTFNKEYCQQLCSVLTQMIIKKCKTNSVWTVSSCSDLGSCVWKMSEWPPCVSCLCLHLCVLRFNSSHSIGITDLTPAVHSSMYHNKQSIYPMHFGNIRRTKSPFENYHSRPWSPWKQLTVDKLLLIIDLGFTQHFNISLSTLVQHPL